MITRRSMGLKKAFLTGFGSGVPHEGWMASMFIFSWEGSLLAYFFGISELMA